PVIPVIVYLHARIETGRPSISTVARTDGSELILRVPFLRLLELVPRGVENLTKIPFAIGERDRDHRGSQVGSRPKRIPRENAQAAGISWHVRLERDFHREVRNARINCSLHLPFKCGARLRCGMLTTSAS